MSFRDCSVARCDGGGLELSDFELSEPCSDDVFDESRVVGRDRAAGRASSATARRDGGGRRRGGRRRLGLAQASLRQARSAPAAVSVGLWGSSVSGAAAVAMATRREAAPSKAPRV